MLARGVEGGRERTFFASDGEERLPAWSLEELGERVGVACRSDVRHELDVRLRSSLALFCEPDRGGRATHDVEDAYAIEERKEVPIAQPLCDLIDVLSLALAFPTAPRDVSTEERRRDVLDEFSEPTRYARHGLVVQACAVLGLEGRESDEEGVGLLGEAVRDLRSRS